MIIFRFCNSLHTLILSNLLILLDSWDAQLSCDVMPMYAIKQHTNESLYIVYLLSPLKTARLPPI